MDGSVAKVAVLVAWAAARVLMKNLYISLTVEITPT
jgi:hypothetical protein